MCKILEKRMAQCSLAASVQSIAVQIVGEVGIEGGHLDELNDSSSLVHVVLG